MSRHPIPKHLLRVCGLAACIALHSASAQETQRSGAVSVNLLGVVVPWNDLRAEYAVAERVSMHASVLALPMLRDWEGYGGAIGLRQYIAIENGPFPLAGLSAGPQLAVVRWRWNEERVQRANADRYSFILAGTLAYKWIWDHVLLEPSLVAGVVPITPSDGPLSDLYLQVALHVGYAW
jgi:hypothetical protein